MTVDSCSLCGSVRSARTVQHGRTYCDDARGCQRRRRPRPRMTHTGPGAAARNADHRISRNGTAQLVPRCLSCGGEIGPAV